MMIIAIIQKATTNPTAKTSGEKIQNQPHVMTPVNFKIRKISVKIVGRGSPKVTYCVLGLVSELNIFVSFFLFYWVVICSEFTVDHLYIAR